MQEKEFILRDAWEICVHMNWLIDETEREKDRVDTERWKERIQRDKETENTSSLSIVSALKHMIHFHYLLILF